MLHLVRDPRAASYSWLRTRASRQRDDDPPMDRLPVAKSAVLWLLWNLLAVLAWRLPRRGGRAPLLLTYEAVGVVLRLTHAPRREEPAHA